MSSGAPGPPILVATQPGSTALDSTLHARAQVDQPLRSLDQSREDVGGERIDREDARQAVDGEMVGLAIADSGIVDDGVETAEPVDLRRHILGAGNGLQIAGDHLLGARQCPPRIVRALAMRAWRT